MINLRLEILLQKYLDESIGLEELHKLREMIVDQTNNEFIDFSLKKIFAAGQYAQNEDYDQAIIYNEIVKRLKINPVPGIGNNYRRHRNRYQNWMVAAGLILLVALSFFYLYLSGDSDQNMGLSKSSADISAPSKNRAQIRMADGRVIYLDSVKNGRELILQDGAKITKLANGQITYTGMDAGSGVTQYNTLVNPRGSQVIDVVLTDGSRVWLNAGSTLTYPVVFQKDERRVELDGEGYFEIAKVPGKRFLVQSGATLTEVLGTHFNISAYKYSSAAVKVTLLEGSVQVASSNGDKLLIKPGQQVEALPNHQLKKNLNADVNKVMAWRNGKFNLEGLDFKEAMSQLETWYDVTVIYKGTVPDITFSGSLNRSTSLKGVLNVLKLYGIKFELNGKKLIVH